MDTQSNEAIRLLTKLYFAVIDAHRLLGIDPDWPQHLNETKDEVGSFLYPVKATFMHGALLIGDDNVTVLALCGRYIKGSEATTMESQITCPECRHQLRIER
jgi:hypothetical protein